MVIKAIAGIFILVIVSIIFAYCGPKYIFPRLSKFDSVIQRMIVGSLALIVSGIIYLMFSNTVLIYILIGFVGLVAVFILGSIIYND